MTLFECPVTQRAVANPVHKEIRVLVVLTLKTSDKVSSEIFVSCGTQDSSIRLPIQTCNLLGDRKQQRPKNPC